MRVRVEWSILLFITAGFGCDRDCPSGSESIEGRCRLVIDGNMLDASVADASASDSSAPLDGGPQDAGPPPEPTRVVLRHASGEPAAATVVFHAHNGTVLDVVSTDATGRAQSNARNIDGITAAVHLGGELGRQLYTILAVGPGQTTTLVLDRSTPVVVSVPPHPPDTTSVIISDDFHYRLMFHASSDLRHIASVRGSAPAGVTAFALDSSGRALAHTRHLGFFADAPLDLDLPAWSTTFDIHSFTVMGSRWAAYAEIYADYEGRDLLIGRGVIDTIRVAPDFPGTTRIARGVTESFLGFRKVSRTVSSVYEVLPPAIALDLTRAPEITSVSPSRSGSRFELHWSADASASDAVELLLTFLQSDGHHVLWRIIAPPDPNTIATPDLPDLLSDFRIPVNEIFVFLFQIADYDDVTSYDAIRAEPLARRRAAAVGSVFDEARQQG